MHRLSLIVTFVAVVLACAVAVVLRHADPEVVGGAIFVSVLIAGAGIGSSVVSQDAHH